MVKQIIIFSSMKNLLTIYLIPWPVFDISHHMLFFLYRFETIFSYRYIIFPFFVRKYFRVFSVPGRKTMFPKTPPSCYLSLDCSRGRNVISPKNQNRFWPLFPTFFDTTDVEIPFLECFYNALLGRSFRISV